MNSPFDVKLLINQTRSIPVDRCCAVPFGLGLGDDLDPMLHDGGRSVVPRKMWIPHKKKLVCVACYVPTCANNILALAIT